MRLKKFLKNRKSNYIYIIAEACDNHFGDVSKAMKMVVAAKKAGADAIKFQHHLPNEEMLRKVPKSSNFDLNLYDFLKKNALKIQDHLKLKRLCDKIGIQYLCTPFSLKAAIELNKYIKVDAFKIGSGEMTDYPFLEEVLKFNKPMIISTGMSTISEIDETYKFLKKCKNLVIMNCISEYPTDYSDLNLNFINELKKKYPKTIIGHSDHTGEIYSSISAYTLGAKVLEKHVTLDKKFKGPDQKVSIDFNDLKNLVTGLRLLQNSFGKTKKIHHKEIQIRKWARRSIVTIKDIKKGELFTKNNIWSKRPGTGIPSKFLNKILNKKSKKNIKINTLIKFTDIK
jgi:N-acetylneuraminate synthase